MSYFSTINKETVHFQDFNYMHYAIVNDSNRRLRINSLAENGSVPGKADRRIRDNPPASLDIIR